MKKNIIIWIIIVIVVGAGGFYGGMTYQKGVKVTPAAGAARAGFTGNRTGRTGAAGAGFTSGQILAKTNNSLTIKVAAGGSEIVFLAPSSQIMQSSTTTIASLNVGQSIMVTGTTNSDGSVTAKTVQVGDFRFGGPRPAGAGQGTTSQPVPGQ